MPARFQRITPFLWFDTQAEEAVNFYTSVFPNSRVGTISRYGKAGAQASGRPEGSVMVVAFELDGQAFTALNGGPQFKFNESVSLVVNCESQQEVDHYWIRLSEGGDPKAQQCGWLKDKYGLSWQIAPTQVIKLLSESNPDTAQRAMAAILQMKKIDIETVLKAAA
ncbi:VOC family protein [Lysobacter sp. CFH 32150]|uniref:VOC family protein n=1 Tax=Lysobacter sp. CFH 32150 TaxID=2927128 RepID=UPI001FA76D6E|nr:VOC family protein [Lysobacter sp. CFH 32150]MCI4566616.1 VOC family protein [Lysobacter sp. CFH 32150]